MHNLSNVAELVVVKEGPSFHQGESKKDEGVSYSREPRERRPSSKKADRNREEWSSRC